MKGLADYRVSAEELLLRLTAQKGDAARLRLIIGVIEATLGHADARF